MQARHPRDPTDESVEIHRERLAYQLFWAHLAALFGLALANVLLGLTVLVTPWRSLRSQLARPQVRPLVLLVLAYVLLLLISVVASQSPAVSVRELTELFSLAALPLTLVLARDVDRLRLLTDAIVFLATVEALLGLAQLVASGGGLDARIRGTLSHYMTFSGILLVADLLVLARAATGMRMERWRWIALVPINLALMGSLTRSAWVGLAAGALCLLFARRRRGLVVVAVLVAIAALVPALPVASRVRSIADPVDPTNYDRLCMAYAGFQMAAQRPATGLGPRMVPRHYPLYRHPTAPRQEVPHLHNSFLQLVAERGLPALAVLLALMGAGVVRAARVYRGMSGEPAKGADLALGALAVLVALNVAGLFENNWGDTEVQRLLLVTLAIPFALPLPSTADDPC